MIGERGIETKKKKTRTSSIKKREDVFADDVETGADPALVLDARDLVKVGAALLDGGAQTKGVVGVDVLLLARDGGGAVGGERLEDRRVPRLDDLVVGRAKEVVLAHREEVVAEHALVLARRGRALLVVQHRQEQVVPQVLVAQRRAPEARRAERVLHHGRVQQVREHLARQVLAQPHAARAVEPALHPRHRDVLGHVVAVLLQHRARHNPALRVPQKDEAVLEQHRLRCNQLVDRLRRVVHQNLQLLHALPLVVHVQRKHPVSRLHTLQLRHKVVKVVVAPRKAVQQNHRLVPCHNSSQHTHNKQHKNPLFDVHFFFLVVDVAKKEWRRRKKRSFIPRKKKKWRGE